MNHANEPGDLYARVLRRVHARALVITDRRPVSLCGIPEENLGSQSNADSVSVDRTHQKASKWTAQQHKQ